MLQDNCYNETMMTVRGTVEWFSSGCHGTCEPQDSVSTALHTKHCEAAPKFCPGG